MVSNAGKFLKRECILNVNGLRLVTNHLRNIMGTVMIINTRAGKFGFEP